MLRFFNSYHRRRYRRIRRIDIAKVQLFFKLPKLFSTFLIFCINTFIREDSFYGAGRQIYPTCYLLNHRIYTPLRVLVSKLTEEFTYLFIATLKTLFTLFAFKLHIKENEEFYSAKI